MASAILAIRAVEFPTADRVLLGLWLVLAIIGFVAITSASVEYAAVRHQDPFHHSARHAIHMGLGLVLAALVYTLPVKFWLKTDWIWLFAGLLMLVLVLIPGPGIKVNGSQRWLALGPLTLQASEFAKLFLVVYLAGYLQRREEQIRSQWQGFVKPMAAVFAVTLLLLAEPDFGATVVTVAVAFGMLFLAGARLGHFLLVALVSVLALAVLLVSEPYRVQRLIAYTDPWRTSSTAATSSPSR